MEKAKIMDFIKARGYEPKETTEDTVTVEELSLEAIRALGDELISSKLCEPGGIENPKLPTVWLLTPLSGNMMSYGMRVEFS